MTDTLSPDDNCACAGCQLRRFMLAASSEETQPSPEEAVEEMANIFATLVRDIVSTELQPFIWLFSISPLVLSKLQTPSQTHTSNQKVPH